MTLLPVVLLLAQINPGLEPGLFQQDAKSIMVACADKARAAEPRDSRSLAQFAGVYLAAGQKERALEAFKRAEQLGPKDATTHSLIARSWLLQRAKAEALAAANRMAELAPKDVTLLARTGIAFMAAGFHEEGRSFMDRAYLLDPTNWQMTLDFGRAALKGKSEVQAAHWFRRTLTGHTGYDQVWKAVGLAYAEEMP